jgi:hypothetical protein
MFDKREATSFKEIEFSYFVSSATFHSNDYDGWYYSEYLRMERMMGEKFKIYELDIGVGIEF